MQTMDSIYPWFDEDASKYEQIQMHNGFFGRWGGTQAKNLQRYFSWAQARKTEYAYW